MSENPTNDPDFLWRKETHFFIIEVQVGTSWHRHGQGQYSTIDLERQAARRFLIDPSISGVKIHEEAVVHRRYQRYEQECDNVIELPKKFAPTGREQPCRKCKKSAKVASNGRDEFTFCPCGATLPA